MIEKKRPRRRKPRLNKNRSTHQHRTFDGKGINIPRSRGALSKALEKYTNLAQDAFSNGDRIVAENYYQYAEHYQRVLNEIVDDDKHGDSEKNPLQNNGTNFKPSRTERALNAKNIRDEKLNNESTLQRKDKNVVKDDIESNQEADKKITSDGLEALKPFEI